VTLDSPILWSTIIVDQPRDPVVQLSIQRSLTLPLKLYYFDGSWDTDNLSQLAPHCGRLEKCFADLVYFKGLEFLQKPAPLLRSLDLSDGLLSNGILPSIFSGETPRLEDLSLTHIVSWPKNRFANLIHISLKKQGDFGRYTLMEFLGFLRDSPRLQTLKLSDAGPMWSDVSIQHPGLRPITCAVLDHLQTLEIIFHELAPPVGKLANFLSHLRYPDTTDVTIWASTQNAHYDLTSLFLLTCDTLSPSIHKVKMVHTEEIKAVTAAGELTITGQISASQSLEVLQRCPVDRITELYLTLESCCEDDYLEWERILEGLSSVEVLEVSLPDPECTIQVLRDSASVAHLNLQDLSIFIPIRHVDAQFDLCNFVWSRFSAGMTLQRIKIISDVKKPWRSAERYLKRYVTLVEIAAHS